LSNLHLVTVSKWLASKVENSFLKNIPKSVIYNGINLDVFKPNLDLNFLKNSYNNKFIILGVASPWNTRKGLNDFVKLSNYLNDDEIIMLIGLSDSQISTLPNNIIGIPKIIDKQTLSKYYSRANIFLNLSIEETFGLTTVEAMACGTPVIVYNSTACPEIVSDATGFIVEKHDIVSIRDIIRDFKQNENMRNSMSINCRKHVFDKFNSVDRYLEYVTLYTKILN
jgi:glycosyltransferase involved in cell wall biosynthesis